MDEVSIEVKQGECVALVGGERRRQEHLVEKRSPASADRGEGRSISTARTSQAGQRELRSRTGLSLCPEGRQLFPQMTVLENLLLGLGSNRGKAVREERLEEVQELFRFSATDPVRRLGRSAAVSSRWSHSHGR